MKSFLKSSLKPSFVLSLSVVAGLAVALLSSRAQAPAPSAAAPQPQAAHSHPGPSNLQVLPKNLTGEQVHDIMEGWAGQLGTGCHTCHAEDATRTAPNGRHPLNFADDSKPEKATARLMYRMTEEINAKYVSKVENSGEAVTCGTCHRGHLGPQPFVPEGDGHDHPPAQKPPAPK